MIENECSSIYDESFPKKTLIFSIKKIKNQKKWSKEEDKLLLKLAEKYNEKHWKEISKRFENKNALQCFSRYKRIKPGIVKGSWKKEEDLRIIELIRKYGKAWSKIAKIIVTRNGKQIRDRFINVLDPNIKKGKFTAEEDQKLIDLFHRIGPKWAVIAKYFPNRTADMIKNRFHSSIKKRIFEDNYKQLMKINPKTITNNDEKQVDSEQILVSSYQEATTPIESEDTVSSSRKQSFDESNNIFNINGNVASTSNTFSTDMLYSYISNGDVGQNNNEDKFNSFNFFVDNYNNSLYNNNSWNFEDYFSM